MIGYGMAKAAVHQLVKSLAEPKSGLPEGAFCAGISTITYMVYGLLGPLIFPIVKSKKGPAVTYCASYSLGSCP